MALRAIPGYRFDFADLIRPAPVVNVRPDVVEIPPGFELVPPVPRPRWLPPLIPMFRASEPLVIRVVGEAAAVFAERLLGALSSVVSSAGADAGVCVWRDDVRLVASAHGFDALPINPHAVVVACELEQGSIWTASRIARSIDPERVFAVVHGRDPRLEKALGLNVDPPRVHRFPAFALGRCWWRRDEFSRAAFKLASAAVAGYRRRLP